MKRQRPPSIRMFGYLIFGATVISVGLLLIYYGELRADALSQGRSAASPLLAVMWVIGYNLCFWVAIARRASNIARWLLLGLTALGLLNQFLEYDSYLRLGSFYLATTVVASLVQIAAVAILFRRDAAHWLCNRGTMEPDEAEIFR
ncbi:hypothetical protein [Novosphingobium mangrovi (ex Huang et al. 2023)]|uniref:Uncharacterized protein n=1 Tax=Novosphingobium mangrovi (ex Huang et al. 2023) TaxID=2976432 RepID=A0ABT2I982_9SPHN|nr:hypothetical protein [Novosphingobium mangrovi (ex Huang et al. 2023)]MCT2401344.1 hypothetical protein [Novosphingobium mangrovi (ex Huang et al. 2023)]